MRRKSNDIVGRSQVLILTFGLLIGFLSLTMGLGNLKQSSPKQDSHHEGPKIEIVQSIDAITSTFQVNLDYQYLILEVIPTAPVEDEKEVESDEPKTFTSKAIKVLLRRIISPNAP